MSFKSFTIGALASAAVVSGSMLLATPVGAMSLALGNSTMKGTYPISNFSGSGDLGFNLNFSDMNGTNRGGAFVGLTGSPVAQSLALLKTGNTFSSSGITFLLLALIIGLLLDGESASVGPNPSNLTVALNNPQLNINNLGSAEDNNPQNAGETQEVPTPALLPGLVGVGVAAFRKRRLVNKDAVNA